MDGYVGKAFTVTADLGPSYSGLSTVMFRIREADGTVFVDWTAGPIGDGTVVDEQAPGVYGIEIGADTFDDRFDGYIDARSDVGGRELTVPLTIEELLAPESTIAALTDPLYITPDDLRESRSLMGTTHADADIERAANDACRAVDDVCGRRFWLDDDAEQVRYVRPTSRSLFVIPDLVELTEIVAADANGAYTDPWDASGFSLEPLNAAADGKPYEWIRTLGVRYSWPGWRLAGGPGSWPLVRITGRFGWPAVPGPIVTASLIYASRLLLRRRNAPFGIVTVGTDDAAAMRLARTDPDVGPLLKPYIKETPWQM